MTKVTIDRELIEQALEAMEQRAPFDAGEAIAYDARKTAAILALRGTLAEQELKLYEGLGVPLFPVEPQAKVLLTDDYGKPDEMPEEAWRQLTQVIPFRLRQVMNGHIYSLDVLHDSLNRVADYCLDGYGWATGQWKPVGQYGVAIESNTRNQGDLSIQGNSHITQPSMGKSHSSTEYHQTVASPPPPAEPAAEPTGKLFHAKFNVGEHVWYMKNSKPTEVVISAIEVFFVDTNQDRITYNAKNVTNSISWLDHTKMQEAWLFRTKAELLESL